MRAAYIRSRGGRQATAVVASALLVGTIGATLAGFALASSDILSRIETEVGAEGRTIRIGLVVPMRYLSHTPADRGDTIQVRLQPLASGSKGGIDLAQTQVFSRDASSSFSLSEVRYEGDDPAGPLLTLRFEEPVSFRVRSAKDLRSLLVVLTEPTAGFYAVNILSSREPTDPASLARHPEFAGHLVYATQFRKRGVLWQRIRVGWYATRPQAELAASRLRRAFPQAWVDKVDETEKRTALKAVGGGIAAGHGGPIPATVGPASRAPATGAVRANVPATTAKPRSAADERAAELLLAARRAITAREYSKTVQLCAKVLELEAPDYQAEARELLGVARERNGQRAHAKAEYEEYLRRYPDGEGAERVRQRLTALITASLPGRKPLRKKKATTFASGWERYGSFSQFYRRDQSFTGPSGATVSQSSLDTTLDATGRRRGERVDLRTQFTGRYLFDFLDSSESELRVSELYADGNDGRTGLSGRLGRQSRSTGGVLGRFDGALLSYRPLRQVLLTAVSGFPVESSTGQGVDTSRSLYGLSLDLGTFAERWDANAFFIEQQVDGILDRRAVGGELRYFDAARSFFSLFDYDVSYNELNTMLLLGTVIFPDSTTVNLTLDYRKSPLLTTSNALSGQTVDSIDELLGTMSEEQVRQLARDRTADSQSFTIGGSRPLTAKLQLSGDFTISNTSSTPASGGVSATPSTGNEFRYGLQLTGSSLVKAGDITTVGLQIGDTSTSTTAALTLNTRYPVNSAWRINPRLRFDVREGVGSAADRLSLRPSARVEYRWRKRYRFEVEAGGEWMNEHAASSTDQTYGYFLNMGYRADF